MLTSLLATSDLAREVAVRRYADAGKLMRAPFRAASFCSRSAGCSHRPPIANWRQPSGPRPGPSLQNRMRNGGHPQLSPKLPCPDGFPGPLIPSHLVLGQGGSNRRWAFDPFPRLSFAMAAFLDLTPFPSCLAGAARIECSLKEHLAMGVFPGYPWNMRQTAHRPPATGAVFAAGPSRNTESCLWSITRPRATGAARPSPRTLRRSARIATPGQRIFKSSGARSGCAA